MLSLTRKKGQSIMIGDDIEIVLVSSCFESAKIAINAPRSIPIYRDEIYQKIKEQEQFKKNNDDEKEELEI